MERNNELLNKDSHNRADRIGDDLYPAIATDDGMDFRQDADASGICADDGWGAMGDMGGEESVFIALDSGESLDLYEQRHFSSVGRKGLLANNSDTSVEYYSVAEKLAYSQICRHVDSIFGKRYRRGGVSRRGNCAKRIEEIESAMYYFFSKYSTFEAACELLECRSGIFRLRVQFEMFLRMYYFSSKMKFDVVGIPDFLRDEILFTSGEKGMTLCKSIWQQPGITIGQLEALYGQNVQNDLIPFVDAGIVAINYIFCYVVRRSPSFVSSFLRLQ